MIRKYNLRHPKRSTYFLAGLSFLTGISILGLLGFTFLQSITFVRGKAVEIAKSGYAHELRQKVRHEVCSGLPKLVPRIEDKFEKWCPVGPEPVYMNRASL